MIFFSINISSLTFLKPPEILKMKQIIHKLRSDIPVVTT